MPVMIVATVPTITLVLFCVGAVERGARGREAPPVVGARRARLVAPGGRG